MNKNQNKKSLNKSLFIALSFLALSACKTSQDTVRSDDSYVDPTQVRTIEAQPTNTIPLQHAESVENLQRELAVTQGELENVRNASQRERETLNAKVAQLEEQLQKSNEENLRLKSGSTAVVNDDNKPGKKSTAAALWEMARKDLREGRVKESVGPLEEIVKTYPKDTHAFHALMILGMAQYRLQKYQEAALNFNQAIDKYAKKPDVSIAWFGQGAAFLQMKQVDDSKLFFEELVKRYPKSAEAREARRLLKRKAKAPADLFATFSVWSAAVLK